MANRSPLASQLGAAIRGLLLLTVVVGIAYPLAITAIAQVAFPDQADGSLVERDGVVVGSSLIGQAFTRPVERDGKAVLDDAGDPVMEPDPAYFQSRPSAAGTGYDTLSSGASNLAATSPELEHLVRQRRLEVAALNGVPASSVPADALLASGSGLDPDISPQYAALQVDRVARARGLPPDLVRDLVDAHTTGRAWGFLGEPTVNVLELNLALDRVAGGQEK